MRFASMHPKDSSGALALLAAGVADIEKAQYQDGIRHLENAEKRLPQLADYISFQLGQALLMLQRYEPAVERLESVMKAVPASPLQGRAALQLATAHLESGATPSAFAVLQKYARRLPRPDGDLALASAYAASGNLAMAASCAQRVYYGYPASKQAAEAAKILEQLRKELGRSFPPPAPEAMLGRAGKWMEARDYRRARAEYESLVSQLGGAQKELAQVRAGAARRMAGEAASSFAYLKALTPRSPEAQAERLYYLVQSARSVEDPAAMLDFVSRLEVLDPASEWRLSALIWAGNYYLLRNEPASYVPLYRACHEGFPTDPRASYCHWKVAWDAYLQRRAEAGELLRDHLKRFPQSDKRAAALYFLGRLSEASGGLDGAQPFYQEILARYPNNFYAPLAAQRRGGEVTMNAAPLSFEPSGVNLRRISRTRLLSSAGLSDYAESELRFAAREDGQPRAMALELARQAAARGAPDQGLRYIKAVFPEYLATPLNAAPAEFWRLAFPLPFRPYLERYSKAHQLDLYLVAGLIRQESEFNPRAVSVAGARGLMQVMPSSGKRLARTLKTRGFQTSSLFRPDLNIRFGSYHLRYMIDTHEGSREAALAAYNGGALRVKDWLTWGTYKEPAEFIETIPFTETRTYVQAVLRNAWMYERIYSPAAAKK